jgi:hypothetical protein
VSIYLLLMRDTWPTRTGDRALWVYPRGERFVLDHILDTNRFYLELFAGMPFSDLCYEPTINYRIVNDFLPREGPKEPLTVNLPLPPSYMGPPPAPNSCPPSVPPIPTPAPAPRHEPLHCPCPLCNYPLEQGEYCNRNHPHHADTTVLCRSTTASPHHSTTPLAVRPFTLLHHYGTCNRQQGSLHHGTSSSLQQLRDGLASQTPRGRGRCGA